MKAASGTIEKLAKEQSMLSDRPFTAFVKKQIFFWGMLWYFILEELNKKTHLTLTHTLRAWRHGFLRFHYKLYGLDTSGDPAQYVSDFASLMTHAKINGRFNELLKNKYTSGQLMNLLGMPTPKIMGLIMKGVFYPAGTARTLKASEFLLAAITPGEPLVLKPIWGCHGFGFVCLARDDDGYRLNGEIVSRQLVAGMIDRLDEYIVTEFVVQGEFSRNLFAPTANTVRMVTLWDREKSEAFVVRAVLRIGTSRSFPVDNFKAGQGGLSVLIDPQSGELGPGAMADAFGEPIWYRYHPESHAPIQGVVIPSWNEVRTKILDYASRLAFIPYIGWDILHTDKGFSILEVNSTPGMPVLQVHGPFLADPKIKRFFQNT